MVEELTAKVLRIRPNVVLTATGSTERWTLVDYMVGAHGPFTVALPDAEFNAAKARAIMDAKANEIRALVAR